MPSQIYYEMRINYVYYWLWHKEGIREEFINCGSSLKVYIDPFPHRPSEYLGY